MKKIINTNFKPNKFSSIRNIIRAINSNHNSFKKNNKFNYDNNRKNEKKKNNPIYNIKYLSLEK